MPYHLNVGMGRETAMASNVALSPISAAVFLASTTNMGLAVPCLKSPMSIAEIKRKKSKYVTITSIIIIRYNFKAFINNLVFHPRLV